MALSYKKRRDISLLKETIHFYSSLGIFPCVTRNKIVYTLLLAVLHVHGVFFSIAVYFDHWKVFDLSSMTFASHAGSIFAIMGLSFIFLKQFHSRDGVWNNLFQCVDTFDVTMEVQRAHLTKTVFFYHLKMYVINISCILRCVMFFYSQFKPMENIYRAFILSSYGLYMTLQIIITTSIFHEVIGIIEKRYDFLRVKISNVFISTIRAEKFWNNRQLKTSYFSLEDMVERINVFFGPRILLLLILTVTEILGVLEYIVLEYPQQKYTKMLDLLLTVSQMVMFLVSIRFN